jgi:hypothetical protein
MGNDISSSSEYYDSHSDSSYDAVDDSRLTRIPNKLLRPPQHISPLNSLSNSQSDYSDSLSFSDSQSDTDSSDNSQDTDNSSDNSENSDNSDNCYIQDYKYQLLSTKQVSNQEVVEMEGFTNKNNCKVVWSDQNTNFYSGDPDIDIGDRLNLFNLPKDNFFKIKLNKKMSFNIKYGKDLSTILNNFCIKSGHLGINKDGSGYDKLETTIQKDEIMLKKYMIDPEQLYDLGSLIWAKLSRYKKFVFLRNEQPISPTNSELIIIKHLLYSKYKNFGDNSTIFSIDPHFLENLTGANITIQSNSSYERYRVFNISHPYIDSMYCPIEKFFNRSSDQGIKDIGNTDIFIFKDNNDSQNIIQILSKYLLFSKQNQHKNSKQNQHKNSKQNDKPHSHKLHPDKLHSNKLHSNKLHSNKLHSNKLHPNKLHSDKHDVKHKSKDKIKDENVKDENVKDENINDENVKDENVNDENVNDENVNDENVKEENVKDENVKDENSKEEFVNNGKEENGKEEGKSVENMEMLFDSKLDNVCLYLPKGLLRQGKLFHFYRGENCSLRTSPISIYNFFSVSSNISYKFTKSVVSIWKYSKPLSILNIKIKDVWKMSKNRRCLEYSKTKLCEGWILKTSSIKKNNSFFKNKYIVIITDNIEKIRRIGGTQIFGSRVECDSFYPTTDPKFYAAVFSYPATTVEEYTGPI